jgi:triacylglycerol lipase
VPLPLGSRRYRAWWAVVAAVVALGVAVVVLGPVRRALPSADRPDPTPGPVVLVPGYGGGTDSLQQLADRLRAAGRTATVLHLAGDGTGDLVAQARLLGRTVDELMSSTGAGSVDVVGYSAGGIVVRVWADELGGATVARRIVLLGTPNHGTEVAALAAGLGGGLCPVACQQLVSGSPLLARLDEEGAAHGPAWVSIWTDQDLVVVPPDSARLEGAESLTVQSVCPDEQVDHGSLPTDRAAQGLVLRAVGAGSFVPPGPADCAAVRS